VTFVDNVFFEKVIKLVKDKNMTISTAESCTGGMLASSIVDYSGASEIFIDGVVTYSNESKIKRLGVKKETLDKYGAVSEQTAREMAEGVVNTSASTIGLATTGIAGPNGGTKEKPVGLVYIAVTINNDTTVKKLLIDGERNEIRKKSVENIFELLFEKLK